MSKRNLYGGYFLNFIYNDIVAHMPVHAFRKIFLRLFNKKISSSSVILMHTRLLNFWNISIGANSVINQFVLIDRRKFPVVIDDNVDIGPYTKIWTLGHDPHSNTHEIKGGMVHIQHHVWIASSVTILPSVRIEEGAVVAAASVVTKNVLKKNIVAGSPARVIGSRNNDLVYQLNYTPVFE